MFVLATNRSDFSIHWERLLGKRGTVSLAKDLDKLHAMLLSETPKLLVLDLELPGSRDPTRLRSLRQACRSAKLVLCGIRFEPLSELSGLAIGASACLDAAMPFAECEQIIDVVLQGGIWLSSASIPALVNKLQSFPAPQNAEETTSPQQIISPVNDADFLKLTPREREVATLVSNGANNKTIARQLLITDRTVKAHLTSIFDKLQVSDRLQLALRVSSRETAQR